ncbi:hypothetical protein [Paraburkholderia sp. BCC1886]|uniref:hypothetical protein n=1 Tax=Paraburkholderia sp. BCC1886 TaxID=2562670 RepID=UPI001183692D|nr:hypothetical protein [Paraburkholderia sp. BCC1886]
MSLLPQEWADAAAVFVDSFDHVFGHTKTMSPEPQERLGKFVYSLVLREKPFMIASADGIGHAVEIAFTDPEIRDFILTLGFTFYSRWGATGERYAHLVESLAFAVSGDSGQGMPQGITGFPAMPQPILDALAEERACKGLLMANKWLVTMLLIQLCVKAPELPKEKPPRQRAPASSTTPA